MRLGRFKMAPCCIKGCDNRGEKRTKKNSGITYHLFPRDAVRRRRWLQALHRGSWQPSNSTVVCSQHFLTSHFYLTPYGLKRLRDEAVPTININMAEFRVEEPLSRLARLADGGGGSEALAALLARSAAARGAPAVDASDAPATLALATQLLHLTLIYEKQKKKLRNLRQRLRRHIDRSDDSETPLPAERDGREISKQPDNLSIVSNDKYEILKEYDPTEDPLDTL